MPDSASRRKELEQDVCVHVFTVSAGMVGVCLTVIGLVRIVIAFRPGCLLVSDLLSVRVLGAANTQCAPHAPR